MYTLNKLVGVLTNPFTVMWMGLAFGALCIVLGVKLGRKLRAVGKWMMGLSVAWIWLWSTPMMCRVVGNSLEAPYLVDGRVPRVEDLPSAEVIELHGGAMGIATNLAARGEMWYSADRVWMAARIWKAQAKKVKVEGEGEEWRPKLLVTGSGSGESTIGLLEDFGVPTNAIVIVNGPRNTEEEARWVGEHVTADAFGIRRDCEDDFAYAPLNTADGKDHLHKVMSSKKRVLVVTSAWHMTRTLLMYAKYAPNVEAIPAACDFENTVRYSGGFYRQQLMPTDEALVLNRVSLHEWIGIWGYRWFRK